MEQTLKIYFTSDVHGYFYPTTYGDLKRKDLGLFSFARDFKKDENTLVIDGGDILQGSAFAYYCRQKSGSPQAIADIMTAATIIIRSATMILIMGWTIRTLT